MNNLLNILSNKIWEYQKTEETVDETDFQLKQTEIIQLSKSILNLSLDFPKSTKNYIKELEIFEANDDSNNTLFNKIDKTQTHIGKLILQKLISSPETNIDILKNRQDIIRFWQSNPTLLAETRNDIKQISELQEEIYWLKHKMTPEMENVINMLYFNSFWNKWLNNQDTFVKWYYHFIILIYPLYGAIMPLLTLLIPYVIVYIITKQTLPFSFYIQIIKKFFTSAGGITTAIATLVNIFVRNMKSSSIKDTMLYIISSPFASYLSIGVSVGIYLYSIYTNIVASISYNKVINLLHKRLNAVSLLSTKINNIYQKIQYYGSIELGAIFGNKPLCKPEELLLLWNEQFCAEPNCMSDKGVILKAYWKMKDASSCIDNYLKYMGYLDVWTSVASLANEGVSMNLVKYSDSNKPSIVLSEFRNLLVEKPVSNTVKIGGDTRPKNLLITGANASGKSTCIKAIIECVLLAQTITIAPAKECILTPFTVIDTYLNIPDCQGKQSLFQAEMSRCYQQINQLKGLDGNKELALTIMDEIFVSTNFYEGLSGAYAIARKMASFPNSVCIITTHFPQLAKVCNKDKRFDTYYFPVKKNKEQSDKEQNCKKIEKTYLLTRGVNVEHLAIDLLQEKGFDEDIISDAKKMYSSLTKTKTKTNTNTNTEMKKRKKNNIEIKKENIEKKNITKDNIIKENNESDISQN